MTTTVHKRTIFDALLFEPLDLAVSQPHQLFISALSVYLVASEAAMLAPSPFNWLMAVGAEWAYLRGLSSGETTATVWSKRLIWAAVALLAVYGSLWGFRLFGALPKEHAVAEGAWSIVGAVVLTFVHIFAIGAVTFCSAMIHRDVTEAERVSREQTRNEEKARADEARAREIAAEDQRRTLALDQEQKDVELARWEKAQRIQLELKLAEKSANAAMRNAQPKMRRDAHQARTNADEKKCPKCSAELSHPQWLAAQRWQRCNNCKDVNTQG